MKNGKFESIEDFRKNATEKDYEDLMEFYQSGVKNFPTEKEPKPNCKYQFSSSAAKGELDKWAKAKAKAAEELKFDDRKKEFEKHSFEVTKDQWERLQKVYDRYASRSKKYVLNALLEEVISKYEK